MFAFTFILIASSLSTSAFASVIKNTSLKGVLRSTDCNQTHFTSTMDLSCVTSGILHVTDFPKKSDSDTDTEEAKCFAEIDHASKIQITLNPKTCGIHIVPVAADKLTYSVDLVFRQSGTDCEIKVNSTCIFEPTMLPLPFNHFGNFLTTQKAQVWLEIKLDEHANVPDTASLMSKMIIPETISVAVVNCSTSDGLHEFSERISDENGCPVGGTMLMPFSAVSDPKKSQNNLLRSQQSTMKIASHPLLFHLHVSCQLLLCRSTCNQGSCEVPQGSRKMGEAFAVIEIFNSIQIKKPPVGFDNNSAHRMHRILMEWLVIWALSMATIFSAFVCICVQIRREERRSVKVRRRNALGRQQHRPEGEQYSLHRGL